MTSRPRLWLLITVAAVAAAAGYLSHKMFFSNAGGFGASPAVDLQGEPLVGQRRPDYTLASVDGSRVSASDFDGKVVLVNFWATWCAPCREEMPMLTELRENRRAEGFEVVGIALDDVEQAREFADELGIEYPILVGSTDVMATIRLYGNAAGTLPYSVLIDRNGVVRWTHMGALDPSTLKREIEDILGEI